MAGSIVKKGDKTWLVRIFLGRDANGKIKHFNKTIHGTKKDAQKFLTAKLREKDLGVFVEPAEEFLKDYLNRWLQEVAKGRLRETTFESYRLIIKNYLLKEIGDIKLRNLEPYRIQKLYNELGNRGLSPRTVRYAHYVLSSALKQAVKWRMILKNPCEDCELPKRTKSEMKCFSPEEAQRFLDAAKSTIHYSLFLIAIETGLRPGEYLGLKWKDLDLETGKLIVQRTVHFKSKGGFYFAETKTSGGRRNMPLSQTAISELKKHRVMQLERKMSKRNIYRDNDLVFANTLGDPLRLEAIRKRYFYKIVEKAGLPRIRLYDLRHTTATLLLSAGLNPKIVSERLGHSSVVLTLDTYSHVLPTMQEDATLRIEKLIHR